MPGPVYVTYYNDDGEVVNAFYVDPDLSKSIPPVPAFTPAQIEMIEKIVLDLIAKVIGIPEEAWKK
jgi:hypothetical protein